MVLANNETICYFKADLNVEDGLRVPRILGLVQGEDGSSYMGLLLSYIDCDGRTLEGAVRADTPKHLRQRWADQVISTLKHLHEAGIVWGDAKAANVLVDRNMDAWIIDFGGGFTEGWFDREKAGTVEERSSGQMLIGRLKKCQKVIANCLEFVKLIFQSFKLVFEPLRLLGLFKLLFKIERWKASDSPQKRHARLAGAIGGVGWTHNLIPFYQSFREAIRPGYSPATLRHFVSGLGLLQNHLKALNPFPVQPLMSHGCRDINKGMEVSKMNLNEDSLLTQSGACDIPPRY
ncbi:hypothetical protein VE01_09222 [Pseudogymnoascus verrucosus]|uniref:Protein kinase domain-containing protein n=1 Tax=Pseudogymnoascus verrucosus TaxID=342668 RepID=A0A1B8GBI0_9PEZI|nr:uncharacterized protein VE01_09222 [Pseudogymnoascus verrucosus]OBT93137.1 hypothetical protein VE01_09222 [Pseudogymnoascus verrucosus]